MTLRHTPPQPHRDSVLPEDREAYDDVVSRQLAYGYTGFAAMFPDEHAEAMSTALGVGGDPVLECDAADRVQPYMGAMLNNAPAMQLISDLGVVLRNCGERGDGYTHADREWVDMVLAEELGCTGVYCAHMLDACAVGVRPEAIQALHQGRDEDLTRDELQLTRYIRQVARGTVTSDSYLAIEDRFGRRGAVEFTQFIGFLLMTIRLIQAFGAQEPYPPELVGRLIERCVARDIALPDPKARIPAAIQA